MSTTNPTLTDMQAAVKDALRLHWRLFMAQGVIMVILGILAIIWPGIATIAVDVYIGWLFLISGIVGLVAMFSSENAPAFFWTLITAALSLVVGVLLLWKPAQGVVSLTIVLIAFFIAEGLFQTVGSISYRNVIPNTWGWMLASGVADLLLAAVMIAGWPNTIGWALGLIVGVNLITSGWAAVMMGLAAKSDVKAAVQTAR
jgi:uncharacterized membrane protein HdeD (DUF308 family)